MRHAIDRFSLIPPEYWEGEGDGEEGEEEETEDDDDEGFVKSSE